MNGSADCTEATAFIYGALEGQLPAAARGSLESHLRTCTSCREASERIRAVRGLVRGALGAEAVSSEFNAETGQRLVAIGPYAREARAAMAEVEECRAPGASPLLARLGGAPWWGISVALHVLVILLLGLITMTIGQSAQDDAVIVLTSLEKQIELAKLEEPRKKPAEARDIFKLPVDVAPTDLASSVHSNIVVPPDILAQAELGDHFETINLDRPDTHSAFGNPDARMFHSVSGNDEPEGGGGMGGTALLDDLIGVGGAASPGTGGGWGGGNGTGVGIGDGSGRGSFGSRHGGGRKLMVLRHGGSKATESAVDLGLEWLAAHQDADGHWDSVKYGATGRTGRCDTAMTSLALLAFLGAGHTEKVGKYKDNVQRAVAWLISKQWANGLVFDRTGDHGSLSYPTAIATMALSEAAGMGRVKETRAAAQKAVDYCAEIHQEGEGSEKGAWRYNAKQEPDISNTGWFVMALKSAKASGLAVNPASFEGASKFFDAVGCTIKNAEGVDTAYGPPISYTYTKADAVKGYCWFVARRCAMGNLCRQFLGSEKEKLQSSVEYFVAKGGTPKVWKDGATLGGGPEETDLYYWYYGTLCTFQQGGDLWKRWNTDMKKVLLENQCKNGDDNGSWNPIGFCAQEWGRVGQTALAVMCLEVYYRYLPMYR